MTTDFDDDTSIQFEDDSSDDSPPIALAQDKRTIHTKSSDPEIDSLFGKWKRGRLSLQPPFQRQFVWDKSKASRLIESALLSVPLPIVYLAEEPDGKESVIDGQQRLTSFFSFIDGTFPDKSPFKLSGLNVFRELNGKTFKDLEEKQQDKIRYFEIRAITLLNNSDPDLKFEIFERLNTGSVPLNDMELRNCVYRGDYMALLKELAAIPEFMQLVGLKAADTRMHDIELVLRFAAFYHATYLRYQGPMRRFFNQDMEKYKNITKKEADELRAAFKNSVAIVKSIFEHNAFKRFYSGDKNNQQGAWETKRFNASLYDVMMGVFYDKDKNQVYAALDSLREGLIDLMVTDEKFIDAILIGTSDPTKVRMRFDRARMRVDEILQNHKVQPRCFTNKLKQDLFDNDPTCSICGNQIQSVDDAAVDHIKQYWKGGQTIPDNARLAHRYCNNSRPRND